MEKKELLVIPSSKKDSNMYGLIFVFNPVTEIMGRVIPRDHESIIINIY